MEIATKGTGAYFNSSFAESALLLDGYPLIEQCVHNIDKKGTMYLREHLLLFMLEGSTRVVYGRQTCQVNKNEMILLKKATSVYYEQSGDGRNNNLYNCLMFSLKDNMIKLFLTSTDITITRQQPESNLATSVEPMNEYLIAFAHSLKPYFKDVSKVVSGQLRLKMMEMLYDISVYSQSMFDQILQLQHPTKPDVRGVIEQHYTSILRVEDLAYLSGRSLSSFKRDFEQLYNLSPGTWIREKRLNKAKEILESTKMTVSEICYSLGFQNVSHFSRIFKKYHGQTPTYIQQKFLRPLKV